MLWASWENQALHFGFPGGSGVKNLPANAGKAVQSLGWEDHLKKETAAHPSILSWKIQRTEEPGGLQSTESQRIGHDLAAKQQQTTITKLKAMRDRGYFTELQLR